jgi:acetoin:2,6-dichlorophenolindophenol oxidoreductase subunit beta
MGQKTVAETIKEITKYHLLKKNGLLLGQSITAVGWVNNTVPNCKGIVELPMTDVAGAGFAVGAALVGRRPFFVVRFQDFMILNGSPFIFFAAKIKELHGVSAPVFIRAIAAENFGPVHSGVLHSIFMHFPGFRVCSPMTPNDYKEVYKVYMQNDDPIFVSEHRTSYKSCIEFKNRIVKNSHITLYAISATRFEIEKASDILKKDGINCNIVHLLWLKPFLVSSTLLEPLKESKLGLVVDAGHQICGASESIAYQLSEKSGLQVKALGLLDRTKCLCPPYQNMTPNADNIALAVKKMLKLEEK